MVSIKFLYLLEVLLCLSYPLNHPSLFESLLQSKTILMRNMTPSKEPKPDVAPQSGEEEAPDAAAGVKRPASASGDAGVAKKVAGDAKGTYQGGCHCGYSPSLVRQFLKATTNQTTSIAT